LSKPHEPGALKLQLLEPIKLTIHCIFGINFDKTRVI